VDRGKKGTERRALHKSEKNIGIRVKKCGNRDGMPEWSEYQESFREKAVD
jgi:hypothetical protein